MTPHADVNRMLDLVQARLRGILGPKLVGLYLTGSLVTGDFDPAVSDIDLLEVTATDLTPTELDRLAAMHRDLACEERQWDNRIEVAYLTVEALRTFRTRPSTIAITSPGEPFHTKEANKDWLINWYIVREKGKTLLGPSPTTFIAPISREEIVQWVREHVAHWRTWTEESHPRNSQIYATLTMCRALYTVTNGDLVSKRRAALWAAGELPEWAPLIEKALRSWREDWYDEQVDHGATLPETRRFVAFVIHEIGGKDGTP